MGVVVHILIALLIAMRFYYDILSWAPSGHEIFSIIRKISGKKFGSLDYFYYISSVIVWEFSQ